MKLELETDFWEMQKKKEHCMWAVILSQYGKIKKK